MKTQLPNTLLLLILSIHLGGCYRYELSPEAASRIAAASALESSQKRTELCAMVSEKQTPSAESWNWKGECEEATDRAQAIKDYQRAAVCGSKNAVENLERLSEKPEPAKYFPGGESNFIMFFEEGPRGCGLVRTPTPIGWALSPIGVPLEITSGLALPAVGIALIPAALILPPFILITCATGASVVCLPADDYRACVKACGAVLK